MTLRNKWPQYTVTIVFSGGRASEGGPPSSANSRIEYMSRSLQKVHYNRSLSPVSTPLHDAGVGVQTWTVLAHTSRPCPHVAQQHPPELELPPCLLTSTALRLSPASPPVVEAAASGCESIKRVLMSLNELSAGCNRDLL